jgi:hypothetical protein
MIQSNITLLSTAILYPRSYKYSLNIIFMHQSVICGKLSISDDKIKAWKEAHHFIQGRIVNAGIPPLEILNAGDASIHIHRENGNSLNLVLVDKIRKLTSVSEGYNIQMKNAWNCLIRRGFRPYE